MVILRKLESKDAKYMLEWMQYEETKTIFQNDFNNLTVDSVEKFINNSFNDKEKHFAIVDSIDDEYLGTISLKNIDYNNNNAEYAISTRKKTRGTGINMEATKQILDYAFLELNMHKVYLNVLKSNERARHFYEKCGFIQEGVARDALIINEVYQDLYWYGIILGENLNYE